jgi:hypothetical protein
MNRASTYINFKVEKLTLEFLSVFKKEINKG